MYNQSEISKQAVIPVSQAAGAVNGPWLDLRQLQGDLIFNFLLGAVTGSVVFKLQDATDISGTGSADIAGAATASLSTANSCTQLRLEARNHRGFIRVVSTVTTGPILVAADVVGQPKYSS